MSRVTHVNESFACSIWMVPVCVYVGECKRERQGEDGGRRGWGERGVLQDSF